MYKKIITLLLALSFLLASCDNPITGNGNGCANTACTTKPQPCNYDPITLSCK